MFSFFNRKKKIEKTVYTPPVAQSGIRPRSPAPLPLSSDRQVHQPDDLQMRSVPYQDTSSDIIDAIIVAEVINDLTSNDSTYSSPSYDSGSSYDSSSSDSFSGGGGDFGGGGSSGDW